MSIRRTRRSAATANFTSYTASRFDAADQRAAAAVVIELARRGCHVLRQQLDGAGDRRAVRHQRRGARRRPAGLRVPARRAINSNAARRGPVDEYLITNMAADIAPRREAAVLRWDRSRETVVHMRRSAA